MPHLIDISSASESDDLFNIEKIKKSASYCQLDDEMTAQIVNNVESIRSIQSLRQLANNIYAAFLKTENPILNGTLESTFEHGLICLLVGLNSIPFIRKKYLSMKIPEQIISDTCLQVGCYIRNHMDFYKTVGIIPRQLTWMRNYLKGKLFRLGRFEYRLAKNENIFRVYRNINTGEYFTFLTPGTKLTSDGLVDGINDEFDKNGFISQFENSNSLIKGHPVTYSGRVQNKIISLNAKEYELVLEKGQHILDLHIPSGSSLKPDICLKSFAAAFKFFDEYFPDSPSVAIVCVSWLFWNEYARQLPKSNIAALQKEVHLFPATSSGKDGLFFIFGHENIELNKVPLNTSLQRAMIDILNHGRLLRNGGMFYLRDELYM